LIRRRPEFEPGVADAEAAQLEKLKRCRQISKAADTVKNQLLKLFEYKVKIFH
jgi:hypothetical protein